MRRRSAVLVALLVLACVASSVGSASVGSTPVGSATASSAAAGSAAVPVAGSVGEPADSGSAYVPLTDSLSAGAPSTGPPAPDSSVGSAPAGHVATAGVANATGATGTAASASREIDLESTLWLTPDRPGELTVTLRFTVPEGVSELSTTLSSRARVVSTSGFSAGSEPNEYEWDGESVAPTITYRLPANRTTETGGFTGRTAGHAASASTSHSEGLLFVDTGSWALVTTPSPGVQWRYTGAPYALNRTTSVAGEGAVGTRMAFLGSHETHVRRAHGQTFRLVVPAAADTAEDPAAVLDSLAHASGALRVGARDPTVFVVAAPTGPDWAVRGLQTGESDAWVGADERLDTPDNAWVHEYVHTRQAFRTTGSARWLVEGSADYYAALFTLQRERITFREFAADMARGSHEPYEDAVLAEPSTWNGGDAMGAQYRKGSLVAGELDRRIRLATDGGGTFASVLARLNARSKAVTGEAFTDAVAEVGGDSVANAAQYYTRTTAAPSMWSRTAHAEAFGRSPVSVAFTPPDRAVVGGPYRNATLDPPFVLATGETLTLRTRAENVGAAAGEFVLTLRVDGEPVARTTGRLAPGERTTVPLSHTFEEVGRYTVSVAGRSYRVLVRAPAEPTVDAVRVNRTAVEPGGSVRVTVTVSNDDSVPATGEIPVVVDGERRGNVTVRLAPNETRELSVVVRLSESGERRIVVGDRSVTVRVDAAGDDLTDVTTPGFGVPAALVSLAALAAALSARLSR